MLSNFVQHATAVGAPFIVGAVDAALFDRLAAASTPVYKTPLAMQSFQLDAPTLTPPPRGIASR